MIDVCSLSQWQHYSIILIVALIELWLGKTDKVKSNSILELGYNVSKKWMLEILSVIAVFIMCVLFPIIVLIGRLFNKKE